MADGFVTLASLVAVRTPAAAPAPVAVPVPDAGPRAARPALDPARADVAQELALLRIAALESFERASAELLGRLARDVLGRELALAPVDLCALAARALAAFADYDPIALVVAPQDVDAFVSVLPVRGDARLEPGDLVVEVADGSFESRFALRVNETVDGLLAEAVR